MSSSIDKLKDITTLAFFRAAAMGKACAKEIVTFDRSEQKFGESPEAQLQGRARLVIQNLAGVAIGALIVSYCAYSCIMHPGAANFIMVGGEGFLTLCVLKEVILQNYFRNKEKEAYGIENETPEMQYTVRDLIDEYRHVVRETNKDIRQSFSCSDNYEQID